MLLKATKCCEEENQKLVEVKLSNRTHGERCLEAISIVTHDFCFWSTVFPDSQSFIPTITTKEAADMQECSFATGKQKNKP